MSIQIDASMRVLAMVCLVAVALATTPLDASAIKIDIYKKTMATSPLSFTLTASKAHGQQMFTLRMPKNQEPLKHLWATEVWLLDPKGGAALAVPLALELNAEGQLEGRFSAQPNHLPRLMIAVRCGEHAPLAEMIYQIHAASFVTKPW